METYKKRRKKMLVISSIINPVCITSLHEKLKHARYFAKAHLKQVFINHNIGILIAPVHSQYYCQ